jgi:peptidoglycan/LPS O-acetylase OafA/YrhL
MDKRINVLDDLRGVASVAVMWFHITHTASDVFGMPWLAATGGKGWLGVEMFFVISGFVIPYSLYRSGYELRRDFLTFFAKRIVRLDPPYLVSIVFAVLLAFFAARTPGFRGPAYHLSWSQLALHLGYLNAIVGSRNDWIIAVYWTLAIEFQYYVTIALVYPLLVSNRRRTLLATALLLAALAVIFRKQEDLIFPYLPLFLLGIATFRRHVNRPWSQRTYPFVAVTCVALTAFTLGLPHALAGAVTAAAVAWAPHRGGSKILHFCGTLSYSLYLIHLPVAVKVLNISGRLPHTIVVLFLSMAAAIMTSLVAAWLLFRYVERPARDWAAAITYHRQKAKPAPALEPAL